MKTVFPYACSENKHVYYLWDDDQEIWITASKMSSDIEMQYLRYYGIDVNQARTKDAAARSFFGLTVAHVLAVVAFSPVIPS